MIIMYGDKWYGDGVDNTVENSSVFSLTACTSCRQQGHVGSKLYTNKILQFLTGGAG